MSINKRKPKKDSMMQIINQYSHNPKAWCWLFLQYEMAYGLLL